MSQSRNHLIIRKRNISPEACRATASHFRTNGPRQNVVDYFQYVNCDNNVFVPPQIYPQVASLSQEPPRKVHISRSTSSLPQITIKREYAEYSGSKNSLPQIVIQNDGNELPPNTTIEVPASFVLSFCICPFSSYF